MCFFQRHYDYLNYCYDDCARVSNTWETELHLSFHQMVGEYVEPKPGIPPAQTERFPGQSPGFISRATIGFRFDGDLFDRSWTATVLQGLAVPDRKPFTDSFGLPKDEYTEPQDWWQRKVLELKILSMMLSKIHESTGEIFLEIKHELKVDQNKLSIFSQKASRDDYDERNARWTASEPILQILEDDLLEVEEHLGQWNRREDERGDVKPRWTAKKEMKYRGAINKQVREVRRQTNEVRHMRVEIQKLRQFFQDQLTRAREEIDFRNSNNITYFTYVTIVFAPLGFGAEIFSMSGTPSATALQGMAICAVMALLITILVLINAKLIVNVAKLILHHMRRSTNAAKASSLLYADSKGDNPSRAEHGRQTDAPIRIEPIKGFWYLNFWIVYLLMELPAKSVANACRILAGMRMASTTANIIGVVVGFVLLPVVLVSSVLQITLLTIADSLKLLGSKRSLLQAFPFLFFGSRGEPLLVTWWTCC